MICNKIHGRTQHRILAFLMSLRVVERPIWLVRVGPIECDDSDPPPAADGVGPLPQIAGVASPAMSGAAARRRYNSDISIEPLFTEEADARDAEKAAEEEPGPAEEDDYWASFHGRASWQREPPPAPAGAGSGGRAVYSWPPAQKASTCSWLIALAHLNSCSDRTLALRLPPQSVHGASLNEQVTPPPPLPPTAAEQVAPRAGSLCEQVSAHHDTVVPV